MLLVPQTSVVVCSNYAIKGTAACVLHSSHQHPAVMRRSLILVVRHTMESPEKLFLITAVVVGLISACSGDVTPSATAAAAGQSLPLKALDPSDPAQAAIMRWHQALVTDDFDAYSVSAVHGIDEGDALRTVVFDRMRQGVPPTILSYDGTHDFDKLASEADRVIFKGLRTFSLVGCLQVTANVHSVRVMSVVSAREIEGRWRVYGGSFGMPSTPFAGGCPITTKPNKARRSGRG